MTSIENIREKLVGRDLLRNGEPIGRIERVTTPSNTEYILVGVILSNSKVFCEWSFDSVEIRKLYLEGSVEVGLNTFTLN